MTERTAYQVIELKGWSYIELPSGALDGPWRYRWEAEEEAERLRAKECER
jgi:hypothetical protein